MPKVLQLATSCRALDDRAGAAAPPARLESSCAIPAAPAAYLTASLHTFRLSACAQRLIE